jgi:hypothetical protein
MPTPIELFISHAHRDVDLAERLVAAITTAMDVPPNALRCTSVPGYKLEIGTMPAERIRQELSSASVVVAIVTPFSLASNWVLFELGATWAQAKRMLPLLGGRLHSENAPGPMQFIHCAELEDTLSLDQFMETLREEIGWSNRNPIAARAQLDALARYAKVKSYVESDLQRELNAGFPAKMARIGNTQVQIVNHVTHRGGRNGYLSQQVLEQAFAHVNTGLYYRLEQLRFLGFFCKRKIATSNGIPQYEWTLSDEYRNALDDTRP